MQTLARNSGRIDLIDTAISRIAMPIANPISNACSGVRDFLVGVGNAHRLADENQRLRQQVAAAQLYTEQVDLLEQRLDTMRQLDGRPPTPGHKQVNADVIYLSQSEGLITLNKGSEAGIAPNMPVVNGQGLVALVKTVARGECQAALITSFDEQFGGIDGSRKPPDFGFVLGRGSAALTMRMLNPKSAIASGDEIVTSGMSSRIPYGIPVGRVISVEEDPDYGTRRAMIDPAFDLGTLREVQILE